MEPLWIDIDASDILDMLKELWETMGRIYITIGPLSVNLRDGEIDFLILSAIVDFFGHYFGGVFPDNSINHEYNEHYYSD